MSRLVIAEKPSVGRAVSAVVGADKAQKGYIEGGGYIVSWCIGHLVGLKYPNDYGNGWEERWSFSQLPMLPEKWQFTVAENTKAQYNLLKKLMSRDDVTEIICATDADREGECIFRYVYNMVHCTKPVMRLWVSSLEESAIKSALAAMKPMSAYDNLFSAGFARAKADWLVGMNGSRLFSVRYGGKLNIGRVQTPTLAMIVKRDSDVDSFVKQKYFTADLNCGDFTLSSARIDDENAADTLVTSCNNSSVTITSVKREVKTEKPPKLYDLTTLQRDANKTYGYTAQQTLDYTQSLYEGKLVTYLEKHQPNDKASFGYHLPEKELYALAERYHHGDDIRRELALGLMIHASDNIADKDIIFFFVYQIGYGGTFMCQPFGCKWCADERCSGMARSCELHYNSELLQPSRLQQ